MIEDNKIELLLNKNPKIIEHYDLLHNIGVLDIFKVFEQEIKTLEEIIQLTQILIEKNSFVDIVNFIVNNLLDKFIPSTLLFVYEDDCHRNKPNILYYENLKAAKTDIKIESLEPYKYFFSLSPAALTFGAFVYMVDNDKLTQIFQPIIPEIIIPFMQGNTNYGFIVLGSKVLNSAYSNNELKYIQKVMNIISIALQNRIYYRRAITDLKTSLYVYDYFLERLKEELVRIKRYNSVLSILLIDIDHFKKINDMHGHLAGDIVLKDMALLLQNSVRNVDIAARFGGEEFIVMLIQCPSESALEVAERFRTIIEKNIFVFKTTEIKITVSIGISTSAKDRYFIEEDLIQMADKALYQSKKNGRNQSAICLESTDKKKKP